MASKRTPIDAELAPKDTPEDAKRSTLEKNDCLGTDLADLTTKKGLLELASQRQDQRRVDGLTHVVMVVKFIVQAHDSGADLFSTSVRAPGPLAVHNS